MIENRHIEICGSPSLIQQYTVEGKIAVVIDVLRATSTIVTALDCGFQSIIPVSGVEEALRFKADGFLIAGERNGEKIPGFDLGNSPFECLELENKPESLVLTTTNGTQAVEVVKHATSVIAAAFINLSAVCDYLKRSQLDVCIICSGWKGRISYEDLILAGAIVYYLSKEGFLYTDDLEMIAVQAFLQAEETGILESMQTTAHFKRLKSLGNSRDLEYCSRKDLTKVLPILKEGRFIREGV